MRRVGFQMQVKKDRIAEYKEEHRQVWPEVCAALTRHGWHRYSLFMNADGLVFGYFETETDFATGPRRLSRRRGHAALGGSQRGISRNTGGRPQRRANRTTPEALRRFVGYYRAEPGIEVDIEVRDGSLRLAAHGGSAYSLHAPAVLEPTDKEEEWLVREGRAAGEIARFTFDDDRVLSYELGAFVFKKLV